MTGSNELLDEFVLRNGWLLCEALLRKSREGFIS